MAEISNGQRTLYARMGGYDVIAAIVDEFSQTFATDPRAARFVSGMSLESRKRNRQLTVDYLCAAAGGPVLYLGPNMKTAHAGLAISAAEWQVAMDHVQRAVSRMGVPEEEAKEFLFLFLRDKEQIVE